MVAFMQIEEGAEAFRCEQEFRLSIEGPPYRVSVVVEYPDDTSAMDESGLQESLRQGIRKQILTRLLASVSESAGIRIDEEFSEQVAP